MVLWLQHGRKQIYASSRVLEMLSLSRSLLLSLFQAVRGPGW